MISATISRIWCHASDRTRMISSYHGHKSLILAIHINTYNYLEPVCPLFWGLNPPKEGPFHSKSGSLGFQVYIYIIQSICSFLPMSMVFPTCSTFLKPTTLEECADQESCLSLVMKAASQNLVPKKICASET